MLLSSSRPTRWSRLNRAQLRKLLHDVVGMVGVQRISTACGLRPRGSAVRRHGAVRPDYTSAFGHEGKVIYIPGPAELAAQIRRRTQIVRARFGDAAVDAGVLALGHMFEDDDDDDVVDVELEETSAA